MGTDSVSDRDKLEMQELARGAFAALDEAELGDLREELQRSLLARGTEAVLETTLVDGVWRWRFAPMVELTLRHLLAVATDHTRSAEERRDEIAGMLDLAGF